MFVRDGRLYPKKEWCTIRHGDGYAIYVMDEHGNLYATTEQQARYIHHSSLSAATWQAAQARLSSATGAAGIGHEG